MTSTTLSMPPSANRLWRHAGKGKAYRSKEYMTWLRGHEWQVKLDLGKVDGPFRVVMVMKPSRRDLDNGIKPVLDLLEHAGVVEDDKLCMEVIARRDPEQNSDCKVSVFHWRAAA